MGNYLLSLRVPPPPPELDERNHPAYYDWTIPKWQPFKIERSDDFGITSGGKIAPSASGQPITDATSSNQQKVETSSSSNNNNGQPQPVVVAGKTTGSIGSASKIPVSLNSNNNNNNSEQQTSGKQTKGLVENPKSVKTSAKATASSTTGGHQPHNNSSDLKGALTAPAIKKVTPSAAAKSTKTTTKSSSGKSLIAKSTLVQGKTMKPETIDTRKSGDIETQAAIKSATNVHTAQGNDTRIDGQHKSHESK